MKRTPTLTAALLLLLAHACSDDGATVKTSFGEERAVPAKDRPTAFGQSHKDRFGLQDMSMPAQGAGRASYTAEAPAHWQSGAPDPGRFRDLRWFIDGDTTAECYLTGQVGGSLAENIRRWCTTQFGQPALGDAEIAALPTHPLLGGPALLLELHGTFQGRADTKMLLLARHQGGQLSSTFRMTAPAAIADRERENFLKVAASVRVAAAGGPTAQSGAQSGVQSGGAPQGPENPHGTDPGAAPGGAAPAPFTSEIPAGWTPMGGDKPSRLLRHRIGTSGECYVGQLGGEVAQMAGIWYQELGQAPPDSAALAALPRVPMLGGDAVLIDLRGAYNSSFAEPIADARLLVAIRDVGGGIVYAKCLGPAAEIGPQREAFVQFCGKLKRN